MQVAMVAGDHAQAAQAVAKLAGIDRVFAQVPPEGKPITSSRSKGKAGASPWSATASTTRAGQANLGIAIGSGTDVAIAAAAVTLLGGDLRALPRVFEITRVAHKVIRQNLLWSMIYNVICIPIAAGALYPINGFLLNPMLASAAMSLSSVSVVMNSLRLRRAIKPS